MNKLNIIIISVLTLIFASCSSLKFHTTKVDNTDFSSLKTYSWLPPLDSLSKDYYSNDIAKSKILTTANKELEARGLRYTKENPEVLFRYIAIVNNKSREVFSNYYYGAGWGGPWGWYRPWGGYYGFYANNIPVGKEKIRYGHIIIEAIDRQTNTVIWQARGTGQVDNPENAINDIPKIITGIMNQYPVKIIKNS